MSAHAHSSSARGADTPRPGGKGEHPTPNAAGVIDSALAQAQPPAQAASARSYDWQDFARFYASRPGAGIALMHLQHGMEADWQPGKVLVRLRSSLAATQMRAHLPELEKALAEYCEGAPVQLILVDPPPQRSEQELIEEFSRDPELGPCLRILGARITHCTPIGNQAHSRQARS